MKYMIWFEDEYVTTVDNYDDAIAMADRINGTIQPFETDDEDEDIECEED